jgi:tRNA pseudouridine55 synthase
MSRAKGDIGPDGFLNLCKPSGPTSHDMVAAARRLLGTRRIGHAGTLDPLAEGVLPLALGRATRLIGVRTSTDDAEGELLESRAVPRFDASELDAALAAFVGEIDQVPPGYSALKVGGRRAYELARAGREVTLSARRVTIYEIERRRWEWPVLSFRLRCSKGTYVRALARDLGERLGVGASLRRLVRLRVGPFHLAQAVEVAELEAGRAGLVWPADALSLGEPAGVLGQPELEHLRHGRSWRSDGRTAPQARAYVADGRFVGLLAGHGDRWQPRLHLLD